MQTQFLFFNDTKCKILIPVKVKSDKVFFSTTSGVSFQKNKAAGFDIELIPVYFY